MDFKKLIYNEKESMINNLLELVSIDSTKGQPLKGKPFGVGVAKALDYVEVLAKSFGFKVINHEGYVLEIIIGKGIKDGCIACHVDTVPPGIGWGYNSKGEIRDDILYGRGACDDKGPIIAILYALKVIKRYSGKLKRSLTFIIGTNEENGMECIKYYIAKEGLPKWALVADSYFPIVNYEMGLLALKIVTDKKYEKSMNKSYYLISVTAEDEGNGTPKYCKAYCYVKKQYLYKLKRAEEFYIGNYGGIIINNVQENVYCIEIGSSKYGINVIIAMAMFLLKCEFDENPLIQFIGEVIGFDFYGKSLNINSSSLEYGTLTLSVSGLKVSRDSNYVTLDIRYPYNCAAERIANNVYSKVQEFVGNSTTIKILESIQCHYVKSEFLNNMISIYEAAAKKKCELITTKGKTYASLLGENAVGYGPLTLTNDLAGNIHEKDEFIKIRYFLELGCIYAETIYKLLKKDES